MIKNIEYPNFSIKDFIPIALLNIGKFTLLDVLATTTHKPNIITLISYAIGLSTRLSVPFAAISGLIFLFVLSRIDYQYIKNKQKKKSFFMLVIVGVITSFSRINDMIFFSNFGKTGLFGEYFCPVIFGYHHLLCFIV